MTEIETRQGRRSSGEILAHLIGLIQPQGRRGWVEQSEHPWLEPLRERHETAVRGRVVALMQVPATLAALQDEDAVFADGYHAWLRERRRALVEGRVIPPGPRGLTDQERRGRLDEAWSTVAEAHGRLASVVDEVGRTLLAHLDEVERTYLAQHRMAASSAWSQTNVSRQWFVSAVDDAQSGVLAHAVAEIRDFATSWRPDFASPERQTSSSLDVPASAITTTLPPGRAYAPAPFQGVYGLGASR
ncbi:hypothetical protein DSM104299_00989 [Baekduia alba]|uniref:hypothetical protein n=1 Tax=Baekduia alba TaxID=2997333 RepID=UPI00234082F1|nr:hypothetical protein [Baekduia alba]WCB92299.1 hypothetical protein DSM104299_00989 [Baekduia alba]